MGIDWCRDGIDNDCTGIADDDCVEDPADGCDPELAVVLTTSRFHGLLGDEVTVQAWPAFEDLVLQPDVRFVSDGGEIEPGLPGEASWILPDSPGYYLISAVFTDHCGFEAIDSVEVEAVRAEAVPDRDGAFYGGCGGSAWMLFPALSLLGLRRKE